MSGRTWTMMLIMLAVNWGGFLIMLIYGIRQEGRKMLSGAGSLEEAQQDLAKAVGRFGENLKGRE